MVAEGNAMDEEQKGEIKKALRHGGKCPLPVGFNYAKALEVLIDAGYDKKKIAQFLGYKNPKNKVSTMIARILGGTIPNHVCGEALYVACAAVLENPKLVPMTAEQLNGVRGELAALPHLGAATKGKMKRT
jgi:hypothetical protein